MMNPEYDFIGGNLALDFANTVGGIPPDENGSQERMLSYADLLAWCQQANLMSEDEAQTMLEKAERDPQEVAATLDRARTVREAIRGIFTAVMQGVQPKGNDLDLLNRELDQGMAGAQVVLTEDGLGWEWHKDASALDQMIAPVVRSAATLLTSAKRRRVRECANDACHWLFIDTTKNHSRQWCRTSGCGNVMRVRKFRERQRSQE